MAMKLESLLSMPSKKQPNNKAAKSQKLAKRTVQIIGFGFAIFLTGFKLYDASADIPWWVVFGFFGFGASADIKFISWGNR